MGVTRQDRAETLASLRNELLIAGPIALLLATLAGYALAGLSLRPVEAMRRRAAEVSAQTPGERLPVPKTGDELERLGETLNSMLARLEAALERERAFVADAGHELRTPLALLRTELELALRHSETVDELRDAVRAASEETDRLAQLAEALLLGARSDQGELALRQEDLEVADLLATVVARFEWRAAEAGRPLVIEAPPGTFVRGDRLRLEQALGNLVDNALRHGRGTVRLKAVPAGETDPQKPQPRAAPTCGSCSLDSREVAGVGSGTPAQRLARLRPRGHGRGFMYAVIRNYTGNKELADQLAARKDEVVALVSGIEGFQTYYLLRTDDGCASVTVYDDAAGADESVRQAGEWMSDHAAELNATTPEVISGEVVVDA